MADPRPVAQTTNVHLHDPSPNTELSVEDEKTHAVIVRWMEEVSRRDVTASFETLRARGIELNYVDSNKETLLHLAAAGGYVVVVPILVAGGAKLEAENRWRETPLICAARHGHFAVVSQLSKQGARLHNYAYSSLHYAAFHGRLDRVVHLIEAGEKVNFSDRDRDTPLGAAAMHGHLAVVRELCVQGAEVNCHSRSGDTPLHWAARQGREDIAEVLVNAGADVNARNQKGDTPLVDAARNEFFDVANMLLKQGANPQL